MYDTETITRHLKVVARMWANLTTSKAANASEAHYQATSAKMASDQAAKAQKKTLEAKPTYGQPPD